MLLDYVYRSLETYKFFSSKISTIVLSVKHFKDCKYETGEK